MDAPGRFSRVAVMRSYAPRWVDTSGLRTRNGVTRPSVTLELFVCNEAVQSREREPGIHIYIESRNSTDWVDS